MIFHCGLRSSEAKYESSSSQRNCTTIFIFSSKLVCQGAEVARAVTAVWECFDEVWKLVMSFFACPSWTCSSKHSRLLQFYFLSLLHRMSTLSEYLAFLSLARYSIFSVGVWCYIVPRHCFSRVLVLCVFNLIQRRSLNCLGIWCEGSTMSASGPNPYHKMTYFVLRPLLIFLSPPCIVDSALTNAPFSSVRPLFVRYFSCCT